MPSVVAEGLWNDSVISNPFKNGISLIEYFLVSLFFLRVFVNGCDINISTVAKTVKVDQAQIFENNLTKDNL